VGHAGIGLRWILPRLSRESLPRSPFGDGEMSEGFIAITWHAVTIMLVVFGVTLLLLGRGRLGGDGAIFARAIGIGFATLTATVLWRTRRRRSALLRAPMWLLFVTMSVLCLLGASA
jgi:hypothetical protein